MPASNGRTSRVPIIHNACFESHVSRYQEKRKEEYWKEQWSLLLVCLWCVCSDWQWQRLPNPGICITMIFRRRSCCCVRSYACFVCWWIQCPHRPDKLQKRMHIRVSVFDNIGLSHFHCFSCITLQRGLRFIETLELVAAIVISIATLHGVVRKEEYSKEKWCFVVVVPLAIWGACTKVWIIVTIRQICCDFMGLPQFIISAVVASLAEKTLVLMQRLNLSVIDAWCWISYWWVVHGWRFHVALLLLLLPMLVLSVDQPDRLFLPNLVVD